MAQVVHAAQVGAHLEAGVAVAADHADVLLAGGEDHLLVRPCPVRATRPPPESLTGSLLSATVPVPAAGHRGSPTLRAITGLRLGVPRCTASGRSGVQPEVASSARGCARRRCHRPRPRPASLPSGRRPGPAARRYDG